MKFFAVLAVAVGVANAQAACEALTNKFAECPRGCIDAAAPKFGCKGGPKDLGCLCSNLPKIQAEATGCVAKCAGADVGALLTQANEVCGCVAGKRKF